MRPLKLPAARLAPHPASSRNERGACCFSLCYFAMLTRRCLFSLLHFLVVPLLGKLLRCRPHRRDVDRRHVRPCRSHLCPSQLCLCERWRCRRHGSDGPSKGARDDVLASLAAVCHQPDCTCVSMLMLCSDALIASRSGRNGTGSPLNGCNQSAFLLCTNLSPPFLPISVT